MVDFEWRQTSTLEVDLVGRFDICDLPAQSDEEIGACESYAVEQNGRTVGYLVPVRRVDPEESKRAFERFDRMLDELEANGWTQQDSEYVFDLTRPDLMRS